MVPRVVTFYSFKGGVGRTLLAANLGAIFARRGRTLLWDLDLEAPGLHRIPDLRPEREPETGFFEWLAGWQKSGARPEDSDVEALRRTIRRASRISSNLHVLQAFGAGADIVARYDDVDWPKLFGLETGQGIALFRALIQRLGEGPDGFDTILLDSRTGITDIGGLLTAILPHVTVLIGSYSAQSTYGLAYVWRALGHYTESKTAERGDRPALRRLLVASPIPQDDSERIAAGQKVWREEFGLPPSEHIVEIPFDQRLLFTEQVLAATTRDAPIVARYQEVAHRITLLTEEAEAELKAERESELMRPEYLHVRAQARLVGQSDLIARAHVEQRRDPARVFEDRVAHLLRLLGFTVQPETLVDSNRVDLIARKRQDFEDVCYFVECKHHAQPVGKSIVETFKSWLDQDRARALRARGMLVASAFSPAARTYAEQHQIQLLSPTDLERRLFDFGPYLAHLRAAFEASPLASTYVAQRLRLGGKDEPVDLIEHAVAWANGTGPRLWLVLGDYGTGKTVFVRRFSYELAVRCESDPDLPVPIAVNLKDFPTETTLEGVLREHLSKTINWHGNPEILLHLLSGGRCVLLLDSFDEMGVAVAGLASLDEQFRRLVRPTAVSGTGPRTNRVLLTSREHFFRERKEVDRATHGVDDTLVDPGSPLYEVAHTFSAAVDSLPPFTTKQIDEYLDKRLGSARARETRRIIDTTYDLGSLAKTPQLLDMIIESAPDLLRAGRTVTPGALYFTYTNHWLKDVKPAAARVSPEQMRLLLEALAAELWRRPGQRMHYLDLLTHLRETPNAPRGINAENVDLEMRTAAFLVRSPDGYYAFSHRSFLEFFLARRLLRAVRGEDGSLASALDLPRLSQEVIEFLGDLTREAGVDKARLAACVVDALRTPPSPAAAANAVLCGYHLARQSLRRPAAQPGQPERLREAMKRFVPEQAALQGVDLSETSLTGAYLAGADLSKASMARTVLAHADLTSANLSDADAERADLGHARLESARLDRARLVCVDLSSARLPRATFVGANLNGATLVRAEAPGANFSQACMNGVRFGHCDLDGAKFDGAELQGATASRTTAAPVPPRPGVLFPVHMTGHFGAVRAATFAPNGDRIVTTRGDGSARIFDADSGQELLRLLGHEDSVIAAAFSPDGHRIVTARGDGSTRILDADSGQELLRLLGHEDSVTAAAFSPNGRRVVTASGDHSARIFDADTGRELLRLTGHTGSVNAAAFSPDGCRVVTTGGNDSAWVFDADSGLQLLRLVGHKGPVWSAVFSPDGRRIVMASEFCASVVDADSGRELLRLPSHQETVSAATFSPDGHRVITASEDGSVRIFDADSARELLRLTDHMSWVEAAAFSPDGHRVVTACANGSLRIFDADSGRELLRLTDHENPVNAAAFSPDGRRVVTNSHGNSAHIFDADSGRELLRLTGHEAYVCAAAFSHDGRRVITASEDGSARIFDADSGRELLRLTDHEDWVLAAAFSPDGRRVVTTDSDGVARIFDADSGRELLRLTDREGAHSAAKFSPDGRRVVTTGDDDFARIFDADSGRELLRLTGHESLVSAAAFSPDGRRVVTASADRSVRIFDADSGRELLRLIGHQGFVYAATFSSDSRRVVTASADRSARIFDAGSGRELLRLAGHEDLIRTAAFSPDGRRVVAASYNSARIFDADSGHELLRYVPTRGGWISVNADGRWRGEGDGPEQLGYIDAAKIQRDESGHAYAYPISPVWLAADLPELRADDEAAAAPTAVTQPKSASPTKRRGPRPRRRRQH